MQDKEKFMMEALKEAKKAYNKEEIPVGAVIVRDGKIIARGHNLKETDNRATHHAEIMAINKASRRINNWRLIDCEMYVTLEPCTMCMGAIVASRIKKAYIGAMDELGGACGSVLNVLDYKFNHKVEVETGILKEECEYILKDFFKMLRDKKRRSKMKIAEIFDKKSIHTYIIIAVLVISISIAGLLMLKYQVEGEKNLPFNVTQISVISTAKGIHNRGEDNQWSTVLSQKNDIYFKIEKNSEYKKEAIIKKIIFNNFEITKESELGEIGIYRPSQKDCEYNYEEETIIKDSLEYSGGQFTDTEILEINNQGGVIGFSILNRNVGECTFSENEVIPSDGKLLKLANVELKEIKIKISFDMIIETEDGKKFRASIIFELPEESILEDGVSKQEIGLSDIVFKRF